MFNPCCCGCPLPAEITVDLGAGGWTDENDCTICEDTSGLFFVPLDGAIADSEESCSANYLLEECPLCTNDCDGGLIEIKFGRRIRCQIEYDKSTSKYSVFIEVYNSGNTLTGSFACFGRTEDPGGSNAHSYVQYEKNDITSLPFAVDFKLLLDAHNFGSCGPVRVCAGTLPSSVEVNFV